MCCNVCRQFNSGYYCQAPQTPTYNFSDPNFAAQTPAAAPSSSNAANGAGRRLLQASNSTATNSTGAPNNATGNATLACNRLPYYGKCGECSILCSWLHACFCCHSLIDTLAIPSSPPCGCQVSSAGLYAWQVF